MSGLAWSAKRGTVVTDVMMVGRQLRYEQLNFWRNRFGAVFTVGFSVIFLVMLAMSGATHRAAAIGNIALIQYYVPGFAAYGLMSACYNNLGISMVIRRETGLLKRLRLSPIPSWALVGAILANAAVISVVQVILLLLIGRYGYNVVLPHVWAPFVLAIAVGVVAFTALGAAVSTLVRSQESAGPIVSIIFFVLLFLSGLWFPLTPGSGLAKLANYFPIHHLILATAAPFDTAPGASPYAWHDLLVVAVWGAAGLIVAIRRFQWEPHRH